MWVVQPQLDSLPLAGSSKKLLRAFAARPEPPVLTVFAAPGDVAPTAALWVAEQLVRPDARSADVRVARPSSDRWTVAELEELVIAPAWLAPVDRTVIVVDAADRMDPACADHLLKTVEEPPARCLFIFALQDEASLLTTLRSRCGEVVTLTAPTLAEQVRTLVEGGADRAVANLAALRLGPLTSLAARAASDPDVLLLTAVFDENVFSAGVTERAVRCQEALENLAKLGDPFSEEDGKTSDVIVRSRTRQLCRHLLERFRAQVSASLQEPELTHLEFERARAAASVLDEADELLDRYVSVRNVLACVFAVCAVAAP